MQDKNFNEHDTQKNEKLDREATFISLIKDVCKLYCEEKKKLDPNYEPADPTNEEKEYINEFFKNELNVKNVPFPEIEFRNQVEGSKTSEQRSPSDEKNKIVRALFSVGSPPQQQTMLFFCYVVLCCFYSVSVYQNKTKPHKTCRNLAKTIDKRSKMWYHIEDDDNGIGMSL